MSKVVPSKAGVDADIKAVGMGQHLNPTPREGTDRVEQLPAVARGGGGGGGGGGCVGGGGGAAVDQGDEDGGGGDAREVRVRLDVKQLLDVNLVAQTFTVHFQLEASWLASDMKHLKDTLLMTDPDDEVEDVLKLQRMGKLRLMNDKTDYWAPRLSLNNCTERKDEQMWFKIYSTDEGPPIVCCRWAMVGTFQEVYELHTFPIDGQDLNIDIVTGWEKNPENPSSKEPPVQLVKNQSGLYRSKCTNDNFSLAGEYELSDFVRFNESYTEPGQSATGLKYSLLRARLRLERHAIYWVMNVVFPLMLITGCTVGSFVVDQADLADRCSITLTLLLAQVAYKYIVAEKLPKLGYATLIDGYVLFCFLCVFFTVIYHCYAALGLFEEPTFERKSTNRAPVKVPLTPVVLLVGWFGLHFVCVIVINAWRTWKRKTDPDWGDRPSATRTALWIGPIAKTDCSEDKVKKWLLDNLISVKKHKADMSRLKRALTSKSLSVSAPALRVVLWSAEEAKTSMKNNAGKDEQRKSEVEAEVRSLNNGFAIVVFQTAIDATEAHIAFGRALKRIKLTEWPDWAKTTAGGKATKAGKQSRLKIEPLDDRYAALMMHETKRRGGSGSGGGPSTLMTGLPWKLGSLKQRRNVEAS
jgi:hypothetical protein